MTLVIFFTGYYATSHSNDLMIISKRNITDQNILKSTYDIFKEENQKKTIYDFLNTYFEQMVVEYDKGNFNNAENIARLLNSIIFNFRRVDTIREYERFGMNNNQMTSIQKKLIVDILEKCGFYLGKIFLKNEKIKHPKDLLRTFQLEDLMEDVYEGIFFYGSNLKKLEGVLTLQKKEKNIKTIDDHKGISLAAILKGLFLACDNVIKNQSSNIFEGQSFSIDQEKYLDYLYDMFGLEGRNIFESFYDEALSNERKPVYAQFMKEDFLHKITYGEIAKEFASNFTKHKNIYYYNRTFIN
jgi:hypothetical protein